ncbi:VaFE repeat-containing surface-anchored protein [Cumulibacter manganitolerans]|uniref:VaFE repeat-containing surface-anchored protein n=1 Tax=Cumulibacter manganitolerans TaxID=1884992 RepID=UPI0012965DFF|nr:VaFE repeat-containing surface-anchored protein [Cumulibacter manganitolerans]
MTAPRISATIGVAATLFALLPQHAHAEPSPGPAPYFAGEHVDTGLHLRIAGHGLMGTYTYDVTASNGPHATAYCIDLNTTYRKGAALREAHWADAPVIAPYATQVNWLLHHSYPYLALEKVVAAEPFDNGLSIGEAVAATQAAVWHYSNGVNLTASDVAGSAGERHDVLALYQHLVGPANVGMSEIPDTTLSLTADGTSGVAGSRIGPITLTTSATATLALTSAPAGSRIVDAQGRPVGGTTTSTELYVEVPADAGPGSATITASTAVQTPTGRIFTPTASDPESATQSLVLATVQPGTAEAVITVPWRARPALGTTATDRADHDKLVLPGGIVSDLVAYRGLIAGQTYTVVGRLMDVATGKPTGTTASTTFTATATSGSVRVDIPVPAGTAPGAALVVFEKAYDATGALVAEHSDLGSQAQTVTVAAPPPTTSAPPSSTPPHPTTPSALPATPTTAHPSATQAAPPVTTSLTPAPVTTGPPPTTTPPAATSVTPPAAPTSSAARATAGPSTSAGPMAGKALAGTGTDGGRWALIAGSLLLLGGGAALLGRRRGSS